MANVQFDMVDKHTVDRLRKDGKVILPDKKVNVPKDMQWNMKTFGSKLLQGIERGDSVQKIADSILPEIMSKTDFTGKTQKEIYGKGGIIDKNVNSAIRNARTMVTSAENHGRLDSYKDLSKQGVVMKKYWMATPDDRTRPTHVDIDGEEQDIDHLFSNGCMFPGDGKGPAEEVWMCRCSMSSHILGFKRDDGTISEVQYDRDRTLHEEQMEEIIKKGANGQKPELNADEAQRYYELKDDADDKKIKHLEVKDLKKALTEQEIIEKLAGGDKTDGSCASLAFAYCGNKVGFDVTDFRGGKSQKFFSENYFKVFKVAKADVTTYKVKKEVQELAKILENIEVDKQFVLSAGKHLAIIRRDSEKGLQYLELQEELSASSAWQSFGKKTENIEKTLNKRFGCRKTVEKSKYTGKAYEQTVLIADVDSFQKTDEFRDILGYLNTATDEQKKGVGGYAK